MRPIDINASSLLPKLEETLPLTRAHVHGPGNPQPAIRLGLASIRDIGSATLDLIEAGRPYASMEDLALRVPLSAAAFEALATAGAFDGFGLTRREAIWSAGGLAGTRPGHLPGTAPGVDAPALPAMSMVEETLADLWSTGISSVHPMVHVRPLLEPYNVVPADRLADTRPETNIVVAGLVTHRQRPPTAGGIVFMSLEDETGTANIICPAAVWARHRT